MAATAITTAEMAATLPMSVELRTAATSIPAIELLPTGAGWAPVRLRKRR